MAQIEFRTATLQDLVTLYRFEQGIVTAERPFDPTLRPDPINYYDLKRFVTQSDTEVVVAIADGVIVASAYAQIRAAKDYLDHERYAYLGFMYVLPAYRGRGINGGITKVLETWIKAQGVNEIRLDVYSENEAALRAYNKSGFKPHMLNMRKRI